MQLDKVWWSVVKCCSVVVVLVIRCKILLEDLNNMLLLICILLLSILYVLFIINVYMVLFLFNTVIYLFLFWCLCIFIVRLSIFIVPAGTLRLPWVRFFLAFSSVVRQMPRYNPQRPGTARTLPNFCVVLCVVLCRSVYCLCVYVYCSIATGWLPNCS